MSLERFSSYLVKLLKTIILLFICMTLTQASADDTVRITEFSSSHIGQQVPDGWEFLDFPRIAAKTTYEIIGNIPYEAVIHARSLSGAGGLVRPVTLRAEEFAILSWTWRIDKTISGSVAGSRNGDDFPARMLVSFKKHADKATSIYDNALCYVWADREPVGTFVKNPYHDHVITVVVANGNDRVGEWMEISRNVVNDYITAFGEPPEWISAVTVMTDSDNTRTDAQAWYGPISLTRLVSDAQ